uniref:Uncharacterized protein n=1 Tax=Candidatus Kentrum sp. FW TaxID=2126338 RepID=A0A450TCN3_9GAMM|nr:MAG: hypothetical protein BECKFW1821B_GA0114236_10966 [Candidatus Kentron sp. FW]
MTKFVSIRQVATVPGYQKITFVKRRNGKMERISRRIVWHDTMRDVSRYDISSEAVPQTDKT